MCYLNAGSDQSVPLLLASKQSVEQDFTLPVLSVASVGHRTKEHITMEIVPLLLPLHLSTRANYQRTTVRWSGTSEQLHCLMAIDEILDKALAESWDEDQNEEACGTDDDEIMYTNNEEDGESENDDEEFVPWNPK